MTNEWVDEGIEEFQHAWADWRQMASKGISHFNDYQVRDLYTRMSFIQAHSEIILAQVESQRDGTKFAAELQESTLLRTKYTDGAMTKRLADVHSDEIYIDQYSAYQSDEDEVTITKGSLRACAVASGALSREISARLKA